MKNLIIKSIICLATGVPVVTSAHTIGQFDMHSYECSAIINRHTNSVSSDNSLTMYPKLIEDYGLLEEQPFPAFNLRDKRISTRSDSKDSEFMHATLSESGTLASIVGDRLLELDSISVEGPMNDDDFNTLWESSFNGHLKVINLENAIIENGKIPDYALFHIDEQVDWSNFDIYTIWLEKIILPEGITEIGDFALAYATTLTDVNFPSTLKDIGTSAFTDCFRMPSENFVLNDGLEKIGKQAFYQCHGLTEKIVLPQSLKEIWCGAFYRCEITEINIPENLEFLGCFAFAGSKFKTAILPDDCYLCPEGCQFYNNWELTEAHLPDNSLFVPPAIFDSCIILSKVNVPSKTITIGEFAYNLTAISQIDFPATLETIGQDAFQRCSKLESVVLPPSIKRIGDRAFAIYELKNIYCMATVPPECPPSPDSSESEGAPFPDVDPAIPVYIPIGTKQQYMSAPGWDHLTNFIETENFPYSGIENIQVDVTPQDECIYDPYGRKVNRLMPGNLYICNGKKFILTD